MDLKKLWILDPEHSNRLSVSLTIMVVSILILVITGILQIFDLVKTTGPFMEFTYSSMALYFGRKLSSKGNIFSAEKAQQIEEKIEKEVQ